MVTKCLKAAEQLAEEGISVEVIDLRTLVPMDVDCVLESVARTGRLVIAQEAVRRGGVAGEVAAVVAERGWHSLRAPIIRIAGKNTVIPFNLALERASVPQVEDIVEGVRALVGADARHRRL
jgi:pyruvate dehydrogenase E1 component beta subunit